MPRAAGPLPKGNEEPGGREKKGGQGEEKEGKMERRRERKRERVSEAKEACWA